MIWNPEDFGSIRYLMVAPQKLWVPDLYFFNGFVFSSALLIISHILKYMLNICSREPDVHLVETDILKYI